MTSAVKSIEGLEHIPVGVSDMRFPHRAGGLEPACRANGRQVLTIVATGRWTRWLETSPGLNSTFSRSHGDLVLGVGLPHGVLPVQTSVFPPRLIKRKSKWAQSQARRPAAHPLTLHHALKTSPSFSRSLKTSWRPIWRSSATVNLI